jgi:hypothetical protein
MPRRQKLPTKFMDEKKFENRKMGGYHRSQFEQSD